MESGEAWFTIAQFAHCLNMLKLWCSYVVTFLFAVIYINSSYIFLSKAKVSLTARVTDMAKLREWEWGHKSVEVQYDFPNNIYNSWKKRRIVARYKRQRKYFLYWKKSWSSYKSNHVLFFFSPFGYFVHLTGRRYLEEMHIPTPITCKYLPGDDASWVCSPCGSFVLCCILFFHTPFFFFFFTIPFILVRPAACVLFSWFHTIFPVSSLHL